MIKLNDILNKEQVTWGERLFCYYLFTLIDEDEEQKELKRKLIQVSCNTEITDPKDEAKDKDIYIYFKQLTDFINEMQSKEIEACNMIITTLQKLVTLLACVSASEEHLITQNQKPLYITATDYAKKYGNTPLKENKSIFLDSERAKKNGVKIIQDEVSKVHGVDILEPLFLDVFTVLANHEEYKALKPLDNVYTAIARLGVLVEARNDLNALIGINNNPYISSFYKLSDKKINEAQQVIKLYNTRLALLYNLVLDFPLIDNDKQVKRLEALKEAYNFVYYGNFECLDGLEGLSNIKPFVEQSSKKQSDFINQLLSDDRDIMDFNSFFNDFVTTQSNALNKDIEFLGVMLDTLHTLGDKLYSYEQVKKGGGLIEYK